MTEQSVNERFSFELPSKTSAFSIQAGSWKYDYEKMSVEEIISNIKWDARPRYCRDEFPDFQGLDVLELGPSDGYNTAGLEFEGAKSVTSIEANIAAFQRCLILKNALSLRATFLLGDFNKYIEQAGISTDLIFACGILYHLVDPIGFLLRCADVAPRLFLWSFYFDQAVIDALPFETSCFAPSENETKIVNGKKFTYYRRYYRPEIVADVKYSGGLRQYANWLTKDDLFLALEVAGYAIVKTYHDNHSKVPAYNILAKKI